MKQSWHGDATRRHAFVTAGLAAAAALVLVVLDDPALRMAPERAAVAASTAAAAGRASPPARQVPFRQFDASARKVGAPGIDHAPAIRAAVMGSTTPMLPLKK